MVLVALFMPLAAASHFAQESATCAKGQNGMNAFPPLSQVLLSCVMRVSLLPREVDSLHWEQASTKELDGRVCLVEVNWAALACVGAPRGRDRRRRRPCPGGGGAPLVVLAAAPNEAEDSRVAVAIVMLALSRRREVAVRLSVRAPAVDGYGRASQQGRGIEVNSSVARTRERCLRWTCTRR